MFAWNTPADIPLVYVSDATFKLIDNYHPNYRNMSYFARAATERLERKTIRRADLLLYPSEWGARSAVDDYGARAATTHAIPWGANLEKPPDGASLLQDRKPGPCRLLFIGVNWVEKGATLAIDTLAALRAMGVDAELTICGCTPPEPLQAPGVTIIPFLDKNDSAQRQRIHQLYRDADFFILPTRADCFPMVFCEAASWGVPSIAPATGGVSYAIREGRTGFVVPLDASAQDYAAVIAKIFGDPGRMAQLRRSSREIFEKELNWRAWGRSVSGLIDKL